MHKKPIPNTAVIYFSLTPREEARKKLFVSGREFAKNIRIAGLLRDHVKRRIDQTKLPCYIFDEYNQKGRTFGEKVVSAFETVFSEGYDHVVVVGNDTPLLESAHILKAENELRNGLSDIVVGPAGDGGTWLMGFCRQSFDGGILKDLPWNTSDLFDSLMKQLGGSNEISLLETLDDLDSDEDLLNFLGSSHSCNSLYRLKKDLWGLLDHFRAEFFLYQTQLKNTRRSYSFLLRGPPSAFDFFPIS